MGEAELLCLGYLVEQIKHLGGGFVQTAFVLLIQEQVQALFRHLVAQAR